MEVDAIKTLHLVNSGLSDLTMVCGFFDFSLEQGFARGQLSAVKYCIYTYMILCKKHFHLVHEQFMNSS